MQCYLQNMLTHLHQTADQNHDIKVAYRSYENVAQLKYFGTTVTNQNFIQEVIKRKQILVMLATIRSRTFCLLIFCLKCTNRIHKNITLPVILYGCKTWSLALWEKNRLRVFENRVLRRIFGQRRDEVTGSQRWMHNE
jgi:hypothetical protein